MTTSSQPHPPAAPPSAPDDASPRSSRRLTLLAVLALVLLGVGAGLVWMLLRDGDAGAAAQEPTAVASETGEGGLASYDLNGDGIVYQSGMHPWIVQDEPGQCPVCGMDLQPVPISGTTQGAVQIDPVTQQNMGVRTAIVDVRPLERSLRTTGQFEMNERARRAVNLKVGGWVEDLYVDAEGDRVRAGQPLLALYSPELVATQEEYLLALRNREILGSAEGDRLVAAARRRLALFDISPEQIQQLEATGEVQRTLTIYAPTGGTVAEKRVIEGMKVEPGMPLMEIVDLSRLWLQVDLPEQDLGWVGVGTQAVVRLESLPGEAITGRIDYVYDMIDPATRTGTARIVVPNANRRIKPGMYGTAMLTGAPSEPWPVVPSEAVIRTGDEAVIILALGDGRFEPQVVTLGEEADGYVQVLDGLAEGETVVTSAQFLIDSEARLAASIGAMMSTMTQ